jgi:outer membrane protein TolC
MTEIIKMKSINLILGVFLLLAVSRPVVAQDSLVLDLSTAIDLALQNNESYLIASKEMDRANAAIFEAASGALPQITGGLTYLHNWEVPIGVFKLNDEVIRFQFGTSNSWTADLTVSQTLYSGGRTFTALQIAGLAKKMVKETVRSSSQELKLQAYNGFYGALLAQEVLKVNEESERLAAENLDRVEKMYKQGVTAEYDFLRARVAVANIQPTVTKARSDAEVAMSALKNLLGLDLNTLVELRAESDSAKFVLPSIELETAKKEIEESRPEILMSDLNTSIKKKLISIASAGYRPVLAMSTSLQYQRLYDRGGVFDKRWDRSITSAVVLQVPIFDSWKTPSQVKRAKVEYYQGLLEDQAVHKAMLLDFEQRLGRYLEARDRLSAQGDAVELARRGLDIANVRFESGVGTQLEVSDARLSLSVAEINRAVAFHDLAVSYAALLRSLGRDINP